jgi:DNA-directed RNA polymerase specialized sigma24 family protein
MAVLSSGTASAAESGPGSVAPLGRMLKDFAGLDNRALLGIVRLSPQASVRREAACELLVTRHQGLVWSCVRRYMSGPEPAEDLMQVGYVGLLKAISNFDPAAGASLATYAQSCISGELKRHFRDKRWQIRVKRPVVWPSRAAFNASEGSLSRPGMDQALERSRPPLHLDQNRRPDHRPDLPLLLTHLRTAH